MIVLMTVALRGGFIHDVSIMPEPAAKGLAPGLLNTVVAAQRALLVRTFVLRTLRPNDRYKSKVCTYRANVGGTWPNSSM